MTPAVTPGQHRFREAAAVVDLVLRMQELVALGFQLQDHLVERVGERADIAVGDPDRHRHVEIAGRDFVGGADQLADRPHQPVGHGNAGPDRRQDDDQCQSEYSSAKAICVVGRDRLQPAILVGIGADDLARLDDLRIDQPDRIEISVGNFAQLDDRADDVAAAAARSARAGPQSPTGSTHPVFPACRNRHWCLAATMTEPSLRTSAAWARPRPMACRVISSRNPVRSRL